MGQKKLLRQSAAVSVLLLAALFLLPLAFGLDGVWSSLLAAYLALAAAGLFLLRRLLAAGIE